MLAQTLRGFSSAFCRSSFPSSSGFLCSNSAVISPSLCSSLLTLVPKLYQGDFDTNNYPDEWHYRPPFTRTDVLREICNGWKCSSDIARVVLSEVKVT